MDDYVERCEKEDTTTQHCDGPSKNQFVEKCQLILSSASFQSCKHLIDSNKFYKVSIPVDTK